jgi:uncharacterized membrane protein YphA (DoxX/SURF4 family)
MNIVWGVLMILIGGFLAISGIMKSDFVIYRLLTARSRLLWGAGDGVHYFYIIVGILIIVFGVLFLTGVFGR